MCIKTHLDNVLYRNPPICSELSLVTALAPPGYDILIFQPVDCDDGKVQSHRGERLLPGGPHLPPAPRQSLHRPPQGQEETPGGQGEGGEVRPGPKQALVKLRLKLKTKAVSVFALIPPPPTTHLLALTLLCCF